MSFLNKFKYHYHLKHVDNLFEEKKFQEIFEYLNKVSHEKKLFYEISLKYISIMSPFNCEAISIKYLELKLISKS